MRKISDKIKKVINSDAFYHVCCLNDQYPDECDGRVEQHHNLIYAGKQVDELWAILPVCKYHHDKEKKKPYNDDLDRIMISRTTYQDRKKYPRYDWVQKSKYLKIKLPK